ncbi:MAG: ribosome small subunit-dependent GTPase A [Clostridium sp.]|nr:ribosome small subunit-dependent GTPase A [Clostridium sp.]
MQGKIIKGVGGFYYVRLHHAINNNLYECKAKGIFRNKNIKPSVGDDVEIDITDEKALTGNITAVHERKNTLIRPAVTNVDQAVIIFALCEPEPNFNLLDRFLIMMAVQDVSTVICLNKSDLKNEEYTDKIKNIYGQAGYDVIICSTYNMLGIDSLKKIIDNKTTVLAGPSGVGKSSILNSLKPEAEAKTGDLSEKIKRGKHTTRHSELICIKDGTYIMDTPGFSSLYIPDIGEEELKDYYSEFSAYSSGCKYNGCLHINEPDCKVKLALENGISRLRYDNYVQLYNEIKNRRKW